MNILIIIGIVGIIIIFFLFINYLNIKKLSKNIKIGDKRRIFNNNETSYKIVTVVNIYKNKKGKIIAVCEHENSEIEEISLVSLIY